VETVSLDELGKQYLSTKFLQLIDEIEPPFVLFPTTNPLYVELFKKEVINAGLENENMDLYVHEPNAIFQSSDSPAHANKKDGGGYEVHIVHDPFTDRESTIDKKSAFVNLSDLSDYELARHYIRHELGHIKRGYLDLTPEQQEKEEDTEEALADLYAAKVLSPIKYGIMQYLYEIGLIGFRRKSE